MPWRLGQLARSAALMLCNVSIAAAQAGTALDEQAYLTTSGGEVTAFLGRLKRGDEQTFAKLIPAAYKPLRGLAGNYVRDERIGRTPRPTLPVHEVYLRLIGQEWADCQNLAEFMAVAAQLMRRIPVDNARQRKAARGGVPVSLDLEQFGQGMSASGLKEVLAVDEARHNLRSSARNRSA